MYTGLRGGGGAGKRSKPPTEKALADKQRKARKTNKELKRHAKEVFQALYRGLSAEKNVKLRCLWMQTSSKLPSIFVQAFGGKAVAVYIQPRWTIHDLKVHLHQRLNAPVCKHLFPLDFIYFILEVLEGEYR